MAFTTEKITDCAIGNIKCALFDFDGTISLIREGWQGVMIPYFTEVIKSLGTNENDGSITAEVTEFVDRLTGKQTIYQCMALNEAVIKRGGNSIDPGEYKAEYLRRLSKRIAGKKQGLFDGSINREGCTVKGAAEFLQKLKSAEIKLYLASGTDEQDVIYEAQLLGVKDFFDGGIYGARDALLDCSKEAVIKKLIETEKLLPSELVTFGDGYVEIELTSKLGGCAVGVATNEKTGDGVDEWKRERLIKAGADFIIPHFECTEEVLKMLNIG